MIKWFKSEIFLVGEAACFGHGRRLLNCDDRVRDGFASAPNVGLLPSLYLNIRTPLPTTPHRYLYPLYRQVEASQGSQTRKSDPV